ncbi:MAG: alpha/beta fold hydrolase [Candidatus Binatia bacterium]
MKKEKFIDLDGIRTRYFDEGTGDTLLLLHGGNFGQQDNVDCAENWDLNWGGFAESFHVYALDKIGQGFTDNPKNDEYTIQAVVKHAHDFIQAMGLKKVHLVGHSRGGYLAMRLTLEHPDIVTTCTIVDSSTTAPGVNKYRAKLLADAPRPLLTKESIKWVTEQFSSTYGHITESWLQVRDRIAKQPKNAEAVAKMATLDQELFLPSLFKQKDETLGWIKEGRLKTATLLIWGYNDPSAVIAGGIELFDLVGSSAPRSQFHILNKAGHYSYREYPEDFVRVVTDFVRSSRK